MGGPPVRLKNVGEKRGSSWQEREETFKKEGGEQTGDPIGVIVGGENGSMCTL